ncbi:MAG: fused DSP-PTPase phosphatase/NAD kinase-like protein [Gemmataceae bacterium]
MRRVLPVVFGLGIALMIAACPPLYNLYVQRTYRNFRVVRPGVLYRSGQLTLEGLQQLIHDHGIRTVISLRDSYVAVQPPPDLGEEEYCRKEELYHYRLSPRSWTRTDGVAPADENVREFLAILDDPKHYPILVHCMAGTHRTGAYCAIYRLEFEHWSNDAAMDELFACGYKHLYEEENVRTFLQEYKPRWRRKNCTGMAEQGQ